MIVLTCAFLVLGAAAFSLLFVLAGRPPLRLRESRARRFLAAGVVAIAVALLTLIVDSVMTTLVYRVPTSMSLGDPQATIETALPKVPFVLAAALLFAVVVERTIAAQVSRPPRARAVAAALAMLAIAAPSYFFRSSGNAVDDLTGLPAQIVASSPILGRSKEVPMFPLSAADAVMDLEHDRCGQAPMVERTSVNDAGKARSAHHCSVIDGHVISQIIAAVPLERADAPPRWLARICTRHGDTGETHCVVAILPSFSASELLDDRTISDAQRFDPAADLTVRFDPRLSAWVIVPWRIGRTFYQRPRETIDALLIDDATLAPRLHGVSSREIAGASMLITGRWLALLVPAAVLATWALLALARSERAWRREARAARNVAPPTATPYRQPASVDADERAVSSFVHLSTKQSAEDRTLLLAFASLAAGPLPLALATAAHAFDHFPARDLGQSTMRLPPLASPCPPSMELFEGAVPGSPSRSRPFCLDRRQVTAASYEAWVTSRPVAIAPREVEPAKCNRVARGTGDESMNCVTVAEAASYCASKGQTLERETDARERQARYPDVRNEPGYGAMGSYFDLPACSGGCPEDLVNPVVYGLLDGSPYTGFRCRSSL